MQSSTIALAARFQLHCGAFVDRARGLAPVLPDFAIILATASLVGIGYAVSMVWDRASRLW